MNQTQMATRTRTFSWSDPALTALADPRDVQLVTELVDRVVLAVLATGTAIASVLLLATPGGLQVAKGLSAYRLVGTIGLFAAIIIGMRAIITGNRDPDD
jgi:hypothetical protein